MTRNELIELLNEKGVEGDDELFFVSSGYDPEDDSTWMPDTQTEIAEVNKFEDGGVYIVLDTGEFM